MYVGFSLQSPSYSKSSDVVTVFGLVGRTPAERLEFGFALAENRSAPWHLRALFFPVVNINVGLTLLRGFRLLLVPCRPGTAWHACWTSKTSRTSRNQMTSALCSTPACCTKACPECESNAQAARRVAQGGGGRTTTMQQALRTAMGKACK